MDPVDSIPLSARHQFGRRFGCEAGTGTECQSMTNLNNIVQMPDSMRRAWNVYERNLRNVMLDAGYSAAEIEYALVKNKPLYLEFATPKQFSGDPDKVIEEFNAWVHAQILGLLTLVSARDVEIYRLTGGQ